MTQQQEKPARLLAEPPGRHARPTLATGPAIALVFLSSAAVLIVEILATRLVAPYVGINLQVNSAVIGTVLAAIAVGTWFGGRLADRTDPRRLIGTFLLIGGLTTLLVFPTVHWAGQLLRGTSALAVMGLAVLGTLVPCTVLSTVTPLVVKLQLRDLRRTGSVVGRLSSMSTLGGILATFLTGFVLVVAFTTSTILIIVGVVLVVAGVITQFALGGSRRATAALAALAVVAGGLTVAAPRPCHYETEYNCVRITAYEGKPDVKVLKLSNAEHGYVDTADPNRLHMPYIQVLAAIAEVTNPGGRLDGLHLGGGAATLPVHLANGDRPGRQVVYEIDGGLVEVDRKELGLPQDGERLRVVAEDGRTGLQAQPDRSYDLVVEDAFGATSPPWHLTTVEVMRHADRVLREGGTYALNLIDFPPLDFAKAEIATLRTVFPHVVAISYDTVLEGRGGGNVVVAASHDPLPIDQLRHRVASVQDDWGTWTVADEEATARFAAGGRTLTDDHAPVDQLITIPVEYW